MFNVSCHSLSCVRLFAKPWTAACQISLSITNSQSLLKLMSIESVMSSNHLILCHPLLFLPSVFLSIRVFSSQFFASGGQNTGSFSISISLSNEYSWLISFRIDWFDFLAVQMALKSLLQYHIQKHQFFSAQLSNMVQLLHPYMTTGKTMYLTRWTFVSKVTSMLFNMLSRLVIAFLPRSECILILWLQLSSAVISEPKKIKSVTFHCFPIYLP